MTAHRLLLILNSTKNMDEITLLFRYQRIVLFKNT
jgi:hypothetical protein